MSTRTVSVWAWAVVLVCTAISAAQNVNQFNDASEVSQWRFDFGNVPHTTAFDPTMDSGGNASSGSMKVTLNFDSTLSGNNKAAYTRDLAQGAIPANVTGMQMDIKVDPSSAPDAFGDNGFFSLVVRNTGNYDYNQQFGDNIKAADGWRHISVSPLTGGFNDIRGVTWQLYGGPSQNINGPVTLWIDNVAFTPEPSSISCLGAVVIAVVIRRRR